MWYDATVAAATVDATGSPIVGNVGFAPAPVDKTPSAGWLWSWALALEGSSKNQQAAWAFMDWATSKSYIAYDAAQNGWAAVPPGTRTSTYNNPNYQAAAKDFAALTLSQINSVNVNQPGVGAAAGSRRAVRRDPGVRGLRPEGIGRNHGGNRRPGVGEYRAVEEPIDCAASGHRRWLQEVRTGRRAAERARRRFDQTPACAPQHDVNSQSERTGHWLH